MVESVKSQKLMREIENQTRKIGITGTSVKRGERVPGTGYSRGSFADYAVTEGYEKPLAKKIIAKNAEIQRRQDDLSRQHMEREKRRTRQFAHAARIRASAKKR